MWWWCVDDVCSSQYVLLWYVSSFLWFPSKYSAVSNRHDNQLTMIMLMLDNNNIICHIWSDWPPRKMWVNKKKVRWRFARLPLLIIIDTQNICSTITAAARYYSASRDSIDIAVALLWLMYLCVSRLATRPSRDTFTLPVFTSIATINDIKKIFTVLGEHSYRNFSSV